MEKDLSEAITKGYDFVRFTIADIHGIARCKTVPKSGFRRFFETGTGMYVGKWLGTGMCVCASVSGCEQGYVSVSGREQVCL